MAKFTPVEVIYKVQSNKKGTGFEITPVQPLVRCKDCKYRILNPDWKEGSKRLKAVCALDAGDPYEMTRNAEIDEWFCADAERGKYDQA